MSGPWPREIDAEAVDAFHRLYYELGKHGGTWKQTYWMGVRVQKCPFDLFVYQELLTELRPDLIVETGTYEGGGAYFLASICDLLDTGAVVTIDDDDRLARFRPDHPRITYISGSSIDAAVVSDVEARATSCETVLVLLDSDHSRDHVSAELDSYAPLVTPGSYLIVEDTNVNERPVLPEHGPGPAEAVEAFLAEHPEFHVDRGREKLLMTFNPGGYLRRVR